MKIGSVRLPFYLDEGLVTVWSGDDFKSGKTERLFLSGPPYAAGEVPGFGISYSLQFKERKAALITSGYWQNRKFVFANLHLYSGQTAEGTGRRLMELRTLMDFIDTHFQEADATFFELRDHQLDFIFLRKGKDFDLEWEPEIRRIYDRPDAEGRWPSDHFGLELVLNIKRPGL